MSLQRILEAEEAAAMEAIADNDENYVDSRLSPTLPPISTAQLDTAEAMFEQRMSGSTSERRESGGSSNSDDGGSNSRHRATGSGKGIRMNSPPPLLAMSTSRRTSTADEEDEDDDNYYDGRNDDNPPVLTNVLEEAERSPVPSTSSSISHVNPVVYEKLLGRMGGRGQGMRGKGIRMNSPPIRRLEQAEMEYDEAMASNGNIAAAVEAANNRPTSAVGVASGTGASAKKRKKSTTPRKGGQTSKRKNSKSSSTSVAAAVRRKAPREECDYEANICHQYVTKTGEHRCKKPSLFMEMHSKFPGKSVAERKAVYNAKYKNLPKGKQEEIACNNRVARRRNVFTLDGHSVDEATRMCSDVNTLPQQYVSVARAMYQKDKSLKKGRKLNNIRTIDEFESWLLDCERYIHLYVKIPALEKFVHLETRDIVDTLITNKSTKTMHVLFQITQLTDKLVVMYFNVPVFNVISKQPAFYQELFYTTDFELNWNLKELTLYKFYTLVFLFVTTLTHMIDENYAPTSPDEMQSRCACLLGFSISMRNTKIVSHGPDYLWQLTKKVKLNMIDTIAGDSDEGDYYSDTLEMKYDEF